MKKKTVYELHMDENLGFGLWCEDDAYPNGAEITIDRISEFASALSCSEDLLKTLIAIPVEVNYALKSVRQDLIDMYRKIEDLEGKVGK